MSKNFLESLPNYITDKQCMNFNMNEKWAFMDEFHP